MAVKKIETLNKHQNPATNENEFDIENYMNVNWDKIKEVVDNNADELTTTQGKVTTLETDNTKNKQDILDIKENQQSQNDLLQRTQNALINITIEKSDSIHVEDSSNLTAKVDVYGISSQKTREGYNLLNVASSYEVAGSKTVPISMSAGNYTIKADAITTDSEQTQFCFSFRNGSGTIADARISLSTKKITFALTREATFVIVYSGNSFNESQGVTTTYKNLMIYEGADDKEYEEYGETPSPEIPSEIENVAGNIDITVANSNLTSTKIVEDLNNAGVTINSDSSFKIDLSKGSFADWNQIDLLFGNNKKDEQYKLTYHINQSNNTYLPKFRFVYTDGTVDGGNTNTGSTDIDMEVTSQAEKTIERISLSWNTQSGGGIVTFSNIYLRKIEDTSDFVEPEKQLITFPLSEGQKLMENDYPADDGIHHVRKQVEFDGTENWEYRNTNSSGISTFSIPTIGTEDYKRYEGFKAMCTHFKDLGTVTTASLMYSKSRGFSFYYNPNNLSEKSFYINTSEQSDLKSFKAWLAQQKQAGTPVIVEYELAEEDDEDIEPYTEAQQEAYNKLQNVLSYKPVTNVFANQGLLEFKYVADTETWVINEIKPLKEQISTINELLSTTGTSALLLDNMQTDLESEVI